MRFELNRLKDLLLHGKRVLYHALSYVLYKATGVKNLLKLVL